mgnify:CR=1 FL=1
MGRQQDREEFVAIMAQEGLPVVVAREMMRAAASLHRIAELECSSEAADRDRVPCPTTVSNKYECCCDYRDGQHEDVPRVSAKSKRIEYKMRETLKRYGMVPVFAGNPRGAVFKVKVPSGRTNDWGREGVCVP